MKRVMMHTTSCIDTPSPQIPSFTQTGAFHLISLIRSQRPWGAWPKLARAASLCVWVCVEGGQCAKAYICSLWTCLSRLPSESIWPFTAIQRQRLWLWIQHILSISPRFRCAIIKAVMLKGSKSVNVSICTVYMYAEYCWLLDGVPLPNALMFQCLICVLFTVHNNSTLHRSLNALCLSCLPRCV